MTESQTSVSPSKRRTVRTGIILFLVLLFVYNANLYEVGTGDTITSIHTAWTLATEGSIHLDRLAWDLLYTPRAYAISKQNHHWVSNYPILPALAAVPTMAVVDRLGILYEETAMLAGKFTATIFVALSALLLWRALRRKTSENKALLYALVYGIGTAGWSVSAQSLWQHAFSQFFGAWIVYLLVQEADRRHLKWLGLACALLVCGRPADLPIAAMVAGWVVWVYRKDAWRFFPLPVFIGLVFLGFNLKVFGSPLGGYAILNGPDAAGYFRYRGFDFLHNLAAILVSPNRGLFVFSPILLFCFWGMMRFFRRGENRLRSPELLFAFITISFLCLMASYGWWTGGHCYGYRILIDILPFLCFFFAWLPEDVFHKKIVAALFGVLLAASVFVHYVGAFHYPGGNWNAVPENIIYDRSRVWDWRDSQIEREFRAPVKDRVVRVLGAWQ